MRIERLVVLRVCAAVAVILLHAACSRTPSSGVDPQIAQQIAAIKAIDNHAHPPLPDPADKDFDALPVEMLEAADRSGEAAAAGQARIEARSGRDAGPRGHRPHDRQSRIDGTGTASGALPVGGVRGCADVSVRDGRAGNQLGPQGVLRVWRRSFWSGTTKRAASPHAPRRSMSM